MDEHGGTAGLITFEDLFEEVVGEIDEGRQPISRTSGGKWFVRGTVRLTDLGNALGCNVEHPDVVSVSGLVLGLLQRPAEIGDIVTWKGIRIEVARLRGRGVGEAIVSGGPASGSTSRW